jgi:dihydrofolate reductase
MSVYFYGCITLDGYLADKDHQLDWLYETDSGEETSYESFYKNMDIMIMGKRTFSAIETIEDIDRIHGTTKNYVFTHDKSLSVKGFMPVDADVVEFVKQIEGDQNVWIVGGNTVLAPLLEHDMVDTLIIQIAPVLLGAGVPLFTQKEMLKRFHLEGVKQYGQLAELTYSLVK